jgi:pSer/pThr/pTyr-binding forkhead associated (FHA) protein
VGAKVVVSFEGQILSEVDLDKEVTVVGRHPACDIVIDHPAVSGRHMLFRVVNRTVYVEDLASTNGTKVNGHSTSHQVVHHLDMIEVGHHKLHFFDASLLGGGGVGTLESTVHTDYEKTMIAAHVAEASPPQRQASARTGEEDLSRTMAIPRMGPSHEVVRTDAPAAAGRLALRVLAGGRPGDVIALERANTMIGDVGGDTAIVVRRGGGYFLARLAGSHAPRLNRRELAPGAHPLAPRDEVEIGDYRFEVIESAT